MAQLFYNGYGFPPDAVSFRIDFNPVIGQTGRTNYVDQFWTLDGRVNGENSNEVIAAIEQLVAALVPGGDLVFSLYHKLLNADCTQGTQIRKFEWLKGYDYVGHGSGAELVLRRTFRAVIGGRVVTPSDTDLVAYSESVQGIGTGGPIIKPVQSLYGAVQAQQTVLHTPYYARQSGFAVGLLDYPAASTPIWQSTSGVYYLPEQCSVTLESPKNIGINQNTNFTTRWSYVCWSNTPLVASPLPPF